MGLTKGTVKLENDYSKFLREYEKEKIELKKIFKNEDITIEHMGSTAVEGLAAKPIIDIAIGVNNFNSFDYYLNLFKDYPEYEVRNNMDIDEILIVKGDKSYTSILIHLMEIKSDRYIESILFRDYLRNNKQALEDYQKLKEELAIKYANDRISYTAAKKDFISNILNIIKKTN